MIGNLPDPCVMPILFNTKRFIFAPTLMPTLAALMAIALTLYLGNWQQGRAAEKRLMQADFDQRATMQAVQLNAESIELARDVYRKADVRGSYDAAGQLFIDNKSDGATVGYHVITPLKLTNDNRYLLINRGFVARGSSYPAPPKVSVPSGELVISGTLYQPSGKFLELGQAPTQSGNIWQNLTVQRYIEATQRDTLPLLLLLAKADDGLKIEPLRPDARVEKHVEYMLTWYSLAVTVLMLWLVLNLKRR
jgi:surfeit locus 1 family protein